MRAVISKILLIFLLLNGVVVYSQSKSDIINKQKKLKQDIELTNELLKNTTKKKESNLNELNLLQSNIHKYESLIRNIQFEINILEKEYMDNEVKLASLNEELIKAKKNYANLIYQSYLNYNEYQAMMFLLASESLNQMYTRYKYIQQYRDARKKNIKVINAINAEIVNSQKELEALKVTKVDKLNDLLTERRNLLGTERRKNSLVASLKNEERRLKKDLQKKTDLQKELAEEIEELIRKEAQKNKNVKLTPYEKLISGDFAKNYGRLPWPTITGVISGRYGEHWHPVVKGVKTNNIGIDINTNKGSSIRSVFKGKVSKVFTLKGANYTVIIKHGNYYSLYHNLSKVYVKADDEVETKESIGEISTDMDNNSVLHFQIWKGKEYQNPEKWLAK